MSYNILHRDIGQCILRLLFPITAQREQGGVINLAMGLELNESEENELNGIE